MNENTTDRAVTTDELIRELEGRIRDLRDTQEAEARARKEQVVPQWRYWIEVDLRPGSFEKIWDDTVVKYRLTGEVTNKEECLAAGHTERDLDGGGMSYLFNNLSGKLIMATGGGRVYISDWNSTDRQVARVTYRELEDFIHENPDGGEINEIIANHKQRLSEVEGTRW